MNNFKDNAPKTKDGNNEIVFSPDAFHNHEFSVRTAFEGRRLWELVHILRDDRERAEQLSIKHPHILSENYPPTYDAVADVEGLFRSISVPHLGRISQDKKIDDYWLKGDKLIPPFFPIWHHLNYVVGYINQSTPKKTEIMVGDSNKMIYMWPDSWNWIMHAGFDFVEEHVGWKKLYDEFPEMERHGIIRNEEQYSSLKGTMRTFYSEVRKKRPDLNTIRKDANLMDGLESLALFHVFDALALGSVYQRSSEVCNRIQVGYQEADYGTRGTSELTRRLADSAVALCKEYLSEMK